MKRTTILILALTGIFSTTLNAQLRVLSNGRVQAGLLKENEDLNNITTLQLFGKYAGDARAGSILSFGDMGRKENNGMNVLVGEYNTTDTDQLWMHGKLGLYFTTASSNLNVVAYYNPSQNSNFIFNTNLRVNGVNVTSDSRLKENISDINNSLDILSHINGVSYNYKLEEIKKLNKSDSKTFANEEFNSIDTAPLTEKEQRDLLLQKELDERSAQQAQKRQIGFLAQEVQEILPELVNEEDGVLSINYMGMIPIIVEGIKELHEVIEKQNEKINYLESLLAQQDPVQTRSFEAEVNQTVKDAILYQNSPNPLQTETTIRYQVPENYTTAQLSVHTMSGTQVKKYDLDSSSNTLTLPAHDFQTGMYIYTLIVDGKKIDSKKMVVRR